MRIKNQISSLYIEKVYAQNELKMFPFNNYNLSQSMNKANYKSCNAMDLDQKKFEKTINSNQQSRPFAFCKRVNSEKDEYSDPDMNDNLSDKENSFQSPITDDAIDDSDDDSNFYYDNDDSDEDSDLSEFDELPKIDQINISKPEKLSRYAETIFSVVLQDVSETLSNYVSSEMI